MSQENSKFRQQQEQQAGQQTGPTKVEFATAEELLRHDAAQTAPPDAIIERLKRSLANEPPPKTSWWRKLFSS